MYNDDTKLFAKNEKEQGTLINTTRRYSQYIGIEFFIVKCVMLKRKCGERETIERKKTLPNQEKIRMLEEKENYKLLVKLRVDNINHKEIKEIIEKQNLRRTQDLEKPMLIVEITSNR